VQQVVPESWMALDDFVELLSVKAAQFYIGDTHRIVVTFGGEHIADAICFRKQADNVLTAVRKQSGQLDYTGSDDPEQITRLALMYDLSARLKTTMCHDARELIQIKSTQSLTNGMMVNRTGFASQIHIPNCYSNRHLVRLPFDTLSSLSAAVRAHKKIY